MKQCFQNLNSSNNLIYLKLDLSVNELGQNSKNVQYLGESLKLLTSLKYLRLYLTDEEMGDNIQ